MNLASFYSPPVPGEPPGSEAKPTIKLEAAVRLIGGAERVETDDRFLRLTQEMCAEALENERKAALQQLVPAQVPGDLRDESAARGHRYPEAAGVDGA